MGSACSCLGACNNATSDASNEWRRSNCCVTLLTKFQAVFCGGTQRRPRINRYQSVTSSNNSEVIPNNNPNHEVEVATLNVTRRIVIVPNAQVEAHNEKPTGGKNQGLGLDVDEPKKHLLTFDVKPQWSVPSSNDDNDEDVCPTCLEEYTLENPKIITKCSHHYHLSCIFEWQERSETCPICGALMEYEMC